MKQSKKNKSSQVSKTKKIPSKSSYIPYKKGIAAAAGVAGLAALAGYKLIKNNQQTETKSQMNFYDSLDLEKQISELKKAIVKEQESNKKLVEHINRCNKEVIRLQGLMAQKSSLRKEALLRSTIKKLQKNKQN